MDLKSLLLSAVFLFLAGIPASAQETSPTLDSRLQSMDALLARVRETADQMDAWPALPPGSAATQDFETLSALAQKRLEQRCENDFSLEAVEKNAAAFPLNDTSPPILEMIDSIRHYYECRAFTRRQPDLCRALPRYQPTNQPDDYEARCRTSYVRSRVIQLNAAGRRDAAKICEALPFSSDDLYESTPREECNWMLDKEMDRHCKAPISPSLDVIDIKDCLAHHVIHASPVNCAAIKEAPIAEVTRSIYHARCQDALAYRTAFRSKDAGRCGASLVCRMLLGENICGRHLEKFKGSYCRYWAQDNLKKEIDFLFAEYESLRKRNQDTAQLIRQRRDQAETLLAQLDSMMERFEPKSQPDYVSRRNDYRALRRKFEEAMRFPPPSSRTKGGI